MDEIVGQDSEKVKMHDFNKDRIFFTFHKVPRFKAIDFRRNIDNAAGVRMWREDLGAHHLTCGFYREEVADPNGKRTLARHSVGPFFN